MRMPARMGRWEYTEIGARRRIGVVETPSTDAGPGRVTLRFRLSPGGADSVDAVREARRGMIREEWTLGLQPGEASLAEAAFSPSWIFWEIPIREQARCREKLSRLVERANRIAELGAFRRAS